MAQQKALFLTGINGDFVVQDRGIPKPGPEQLLVKIDSAALNPLDWKIRKYGLYVSDFPAILGIEAAGTVEAVGVNVSGLVKGDRVYWQGSYTHDEGTFQQYALLPADIAGKIPSNITTEEAASIPVGTGTAIVGLYGIRANQGTGAEQLVAPWNEGGANKYEGKPILVLGGSSSVGQYTIQFAKLSGFSPIIVTASLHNTDLVKSLGATHVIDRNADVAAEVKKITNSPIDFVFDTISEGGTQEQGWEILAPGGTLAVTLPPSVDKEKYSDKHTVQIVSLVRLHKNLAEAYSKSLPKLLKDGVLKPNRVEVIKGGLSSIEAGLKRLEENKVSGYKLIVNPHEIRCTFEVLVGFICKFECEHKVPPVKQNFFEAVLTGDLVIRERDIPKPGPGQVLVKVESAALNPADWKIREKGVFIRSFPAVMGCEGAGTVQEIGADVVGFSRGDRVIFQGNITDDEATFQQYTLQPAEITAKIPLNISADEAASITSGAGTAIDGLYGDRRGSGAKQLTAPWEEGGAELYKGKPILILGGSSSVGQYAIQFAKLSGFSPIITTASLHNADLLKAFGATHVVDRKSVVVAEVRSITREPIDFIFDATSEEGTQEQALEILASGGTLALVLRPTVDVQKHSDKHIAYVSAHFRVFKALGIAFTKFLPKLLEEGSIKPNRVEVLEGGLSAVEAGMKRLQENKVSGYKLIVHPHETP